MEQAERGTASRSQNVVHFLPRTTDALLRVITPAFERMDVSQASLQLIVLTPDAETAVLVGDAAARFGGSKGVEILPVTSANRAARMLADRPVNAIAGPPAEIQSLVQRSAIKMDDLRTIVLAWVDDDVASSPATLASIESLFGELPREAARIVIARRETPELATLIDNHLRTARRMIPPDIQTAPEISPSAPTMQYLSVTGSSRPAALRRLLDHLDPPSATVVVRDGASEADAVQTVRSLGYRRTTDPIRVARYDSIPLSHTVVLYDSPVMPTEVAQAGSVGPVQIVALATPRDMIALHELGGDVTPITLDGPGAAARSRDSMLRDELGVILSQGIASREMLAIEPLLEQYDGVEIAAAAVRLLDLERARNAVPSTPVLRFSAPRRQEPATEDRPERGKRPPRDAREARDSRGGRDSRDSRDSRDRKSGPPRPDSGSRKPWSPKPREAGGERRERDLGRGPRSGAPPRDDRGGRPTGAPRRPRPFDR